MPFITPKNSSYTLNGSAVTAATITGNTATDALISGVSITLDPDAAGPIYVRSDGTAAAASIGVNNSIIWPGQTGFQPVALVTDAQVGNVSIFGTGVVSVIAR